MYYSTLVRNFFFLYETVAEHMYYGNLDIKGEPRITQGNFAESHNILRLCLLW